MVVGKGRGRIAPKQGKVEYGEKGIVDTSRTRVHQFLDLISINRMLVDLHDADGVLHPRNFLLSGKSHRRRRTVPGLCAGARRWKPSKLSSSWTHSRMRIPEARPMASPRMFRLL